MKLYTDSTGKYQMYIPLNWEYKNPSLYKKVLDDTPQAFGFYDKSLGAFQLSCKKVTDHIKNLITTRGEPIQSSDSKQLIFYEQFIPSGKHHVYTFSCAVDDHYFLATYIVEPKKHLLKKISIELQEVRKALSSIKFIKEPYRHIVLIQRRFDLFMSSIATIMELKTNSVERNSFIEYIVFSANHIDALLRLSIILTNQIKNKNEDINQELLFQSEEDKPILERIIYKKCLDLNIISPTLFNDLEHLYRERNKVIHRFIITDIRTEDVFKLAVDYEKVFDKVEKLILSLEKEQIKQGIGIYGKNPKQGMSEYEKDLLKTKIRDKQGRLPSKNNNA